MAGARGFFYDGINASLRQATMADLDTVLRFKQASMYAGRPMPARARAVTRESILADRYSLIQVNGAVTGIAFAERLRKDDGAEARLFLSVAEGCEAQAAPAMRAITMELFDAGCSVVVANSVQPRPRVRAEAIRDAMAAAGFSRDPDGERPDTWHADPDAFGKVPAMGMSPG